MKRLAVLLSAGVAVLVVVAFAIGHPVAWMQAGLIMWDIAAGGGHTTLQDVTPASALRHLAEREPDVPLGVAAVSYAVAPPSSRSSTRTSHRPSPSSLVSAATATPNPSSGSSPPWTMWQAIVALLGERHD